MPQKVAAQKSIRSDSFDAKTNKYCACALHGIFMLCYLWDRGFRSNTGVELYYGTTTAYQNCARLEMTPVNGVRNVSINGTGLTTLSSGNWDLYSITMDAEMISTIDASTTVGFIKTGSYNRTSALYTKNIAKAPTTEDGTYSKNKQSIEAFDGKTFVINNCADSKNERTSYMGIWCN